VDLLRRGDGEEKREGRNWVLAPGNGDAVGLSGERKLKFRTLNVYRRGRRKMLGSLGAARLRQGGEEIKGVVYLRVSPVRIREGRGGRS